MTVCPVCAEENPERARFCWSCGAALMAVQATPGEERKVVSVLFVDLVGFTAASEQADPEDVRAGLRAYHARVKQEIARFGGTVEKFNGVAVGETTYRATRDLFEYEPLDSISAKGKSTPVALWHAKAARRRFGVDVEPAARTPLIGRDDDLTLLRSTYARTLRESSTQLVTITGEPGVGKTRLTAEFRRWVDDQPELVFWRQGRSLPYGEGITYWALGEMVKAQAGILESDSSDEARAKLAVAIGEVTSEESEQEWLRNTLAPLVGAGDGPAAATPESSFGAWRRFLEGIAAQRPLTVVFEDL